MHLKLSRVLELLVFLELLEYKITYSHLYHFIKKKSKFQLKDSKSYQFYAIVTSSCTKFTKKKII